MTPQYPWSRAPKPEIRIHRETVQVTRHGRVWSGSWSIEQGELCVVSAYGALDAPAGAPAGRAARAEAMLAEIIDRRLAGRPIIRAI